MHFRTVYIILKPSAVTKKTSHLMLLYFCFCKVIACWSCLLQAFYGVATDVCNIASGRTKTSSQMSDMSQEERLLSQSEHLHVSV